MYWVLVKSEKLKELMFEVSNIVSGILITAPEQKKLILLEKEITSSVRLLYQLSADNNRTSISIKKVKPSIIIQKYDTRSRVKKKVLQLLH